MKNKRYLTFLLAAPLLTLVAIWSHTFIPIRSAAILTPALNDAHLYADSDNGGTSVATWLDERRHAWQCQLREGNSYPFCGMSILPTGDHRQGINLEGFKQLKVWIAYKGPAKKLRLYLRNYTPGLGLANDIDNGKFISLLLNTNDLSKEITIDLTELSVADWWVDQYDVAREQAQPQFDNIVNIGIDFAHPYPFGDHIIAVKNIEFIGERISTENWYLAIIATWVTGFFVFALWRWSHHYRYALKNARRLSELASFNEQLESKKEEYKYLSKTDPLTGALNRFGFTQVVENLLDKRQASEPIALALFSVDQFKRVKDSFGLNQTDQFLQSVAAIIADNTRDNHVLCRWEGDEFIILCPGMVASSAYIMAEQIRKTIASAGLNLGRSATISVSSGVSEIEEDEGFGAAFKKIDDALYKAKSIGGNCTIMG